MSSLLDNITRKVTNAVGGEAQTLDIQKILKLLPHLRKKQLPPGFMGGQHPRGSWSRE